MVPHQALDEEKDASTARSRRPVPCRDSSPQGTFVAALKITQDLKELSGFVEDMHALGRKPTCADKRRARRQNSSRAPGRRPSPLLRRDLPALGDRQEDHHQQSEGQAHFSLLERKYDVPLIEAEYKLDAVAAENDVASALQVKPRSTIFHIQRTSYSTCSRPVDYETLYYRGDLVRFVTRLVRNTSR